jgi:hypothetical protein
MVASPSNTQNIIVPNPFNEAVIGWAGVLSEKAHDKYLKGWKDCGVDEIRVDYEMDPDYLSDTDRSAIIGNYLHFR